MKKLLHDKSQSILLIKCDLKMKLTVLFVFSTLLIGYANNSYSQKGITLHVVDGTVASVIDEIEATSSYNFVYNTRDVDLDRKVTVRVKGAEIAQVLDKLFGDTRTRYKIRKDQVILVDDARVIRSLHRLEHPRPIPLLRIPEDPVTGTVRDANGEVLIGVNIRVKGSGEGTTTDFNGVFDLELRTGDTLVFSYVGYRSIEMDSPGWMLSCSKVPRNWKN